MKRLAAALVLLLAVAACGGDDDSDDDADRSTTADALEAQLVDLRGKAEGGAYPEVEVSVKDNEFIEPAIRIDPGVTVAWHNEGNSAHDIAPVGDIEGFGVESADFEPGDEYEFRFDEPGTYRIFCTLHGTEQAGMVGLIVVGDGDVDAPAEEIEVGEVEGTLRVPEEYPTIQEAVDAALPGSLILVSPGVYNEAVAITKDDIVVRGLDRDETILDGEFELENGFKVLGDGVAIENITAQNFTLNGFFWTGVTGYRGSYITAIRNGDYGIYAFDSVDGQFDHAYASGSPDAGYYIGQCYPCNALITDVVAEWNGLGYSGTNAGGDLYIVNSEWRENRAGIVPNSGTGEANPPERETTIVGNVVYSNNNGETSAISIASTATGNGILIAGGIDNVVLRNLVYDHDLTGIAVIPLPEKVLEPDNRAAQNFDARGNEIRENSLSDNRAFDIGLITTIDDPADHGDNCFLDNKFTSSSPPDIESLVPCDGEVDPAFASDVAGFLSLLGGEKPEGKDYKTVELPDPGSQPEMPGAETAPARPARRPTLPDLASIRLPSR
jgi:plastocyanin